jgi:hypothetical protein
VDQRGEFDPTSLVVSLTYIIYRTEDKIAALEAKLKEIEGSKDVVSTPIFPKTGLDSLPPRPLDLPPKPAS